jgi:hypothetical protein
MSQNEVDQDDDADEIVKQEMINQNLVTNKYN